MSTPTPLTAKEQLENIRNRFEGRRDTAFYYYYTEIADRLETDLAATRAELEALRKDKERLDWLEKQGHMANAFVYTEHSGGPAYWMMWHVTGPSRSVEDDAKVTLREAIDKRAALAGKEGK